MDSKFPKKHGAVENCAFTLMSTRCLGGREKLDWFYGFVVFIPSECIVCKLHCGNFAEQVTHDCGERPFETKFHISQKGGQRKNSKEMDIKFWQKNIKQMTRFLESVVLWINFRSPAQLEQKPKRIHKHLLLKFYEHQIDVWIVQKRLSDYTKQLQVECVSWKSQGTARFSMSGFLHRMPCQKGQKDLSQ